MELPTQNELILTIMLFQATTTVTVTIDFEAPLLGFDVKKHVLPRIEEIALNAVGEYLKGRKFVPHDNIISLKIESNMNLHPNNKRQI